MNKLRLLVYQLAGLVVVVDLLSKWATTTYASSSVYLHEQAAVFDAFGYPLPGWAYLVALPALSLLSLGLISWVDKRSIACAYGLVIGAFISQYASLLIWGGAPDFIYAAGWVLNVADVAILTGIALCLGGLLTWGQRA